MKKLIFIAALLHAVTACKPGPQEGASVQSIDNMTRSDGASLTRNHCGLTFTEDRLEALSPKNRAKLRRIDAPTEKLKLAAAGALSAVPKAIQSMFFQADGRIRVVADPGKVCSTVGLSEAEQRFAGEETDKVDGCWRLDDHHLEIIIKADEKAVQHGLVRLFGYAYTQFFAARVGTVDANESVKASIDRGLKRFDSQRYELAGALLGDLELRDNKVQAKFERFAKTDPKAFENFVFAEALDSYYCSATTRAVMRRDFPATYRAFTQGPLGLLKDFGEPIL